MLLPHTSYPDGHGKHDFIMVKEQNKDCIRLVLCKTMSTLKTVVMDSNGTSLSDELGNYRTAPWNCFSGCNKCSSTILNIHKHRVHLRFSARRAKKFKDSHR